MTSGPSGRRTPGVLSPVDWARLESMVDALLDTPLERRSALLDELSGSDPVRRSELERLVAECERPHALLDQPAAERFAALVDEDAAHASAVLAGRYEITRELGRGGMATVYLARDLRHSRDVAVKVLRSDLAAALGGGRFLREVEIAAGLRHPNIVPVYDSGEGDGILYYVMPYEAGHSLRERLERDGPLPLEDALLILRDVCDALAHAHRHGIVHRDIKPDNVLLAGRHALVTDFGVAKALAAVGGQRSQRAKDTPDPLTTAGVSLGTPAYMAPEQIVADPRIDHRADIYAMGVLAYELLAGRPPFQGDEPQAVLVAHLTETPQPVTVHRPEVPPALVELVMRCLEKKAADRWQSADDLLAGLERLAGPAAVSGAPTPPANRVVPDRPPGRPILARIGPHRLVAIVGATMAVAALAIVTAERMRARDDRAPPLDPDRMVIIPFRVLGVDSSLRYLGEGIVDLLAAKLSGEGGPLAVDARTAISAWKQVSKGSEPTADHARRVARMLGAGEALSGSIVSLPGARITITANVIPATGGLQRSEVTLSGHVDSMPSLLEDIATRVVARRAGVSEQTLGSITSESVPALRAYLWGRDEYRRGHDREAVEHFARAIELDSTFALAALDLVVAVGQPLGMQDCRAADCMTSYFALGFRNPGPESDHRRVQQAVEIAWRHRDKLGPRDRPLLDALRGERYPEPATARAMIAGLQRAAIAAPARVETHYLLGSLLLYQGPAVEVTDSRARAAAAFRHALELDSAYAAPIAGLVEVAAFDGDTSALRRAGWLYLSRDSVGGTADYVRWRVAMGSGDSAALSSIRARFEALDASTLQRIVQASLMSGTSLVDAERATSIVLERASDPVQRKIALAAAYMLAMNRGRPREATGFLERRAKVRDDPLAFWTWAAMGALFWDGDTAVAHTAVRARTALIARDTSSRSLDSVNALLLSRHIGQQGLWDLMQGDTALAETAVRWLRRHNRWPSADLVEVLLASRTGRPDAEALRSRIDSIALEGCCTVILVHWANLVVARAHEAAGHDADALRALRRGVWRFPPQLLSTFLRDEARLAAKVGDRAGAIRAYRHYLALRSDAEPELRPELDRVRAELLQLERDSPQKH